MKINTSSGSNSFSVRPHHRLGPTGFAFLAALALALSGLARAENRSAPIPFSAIGAKATADYQGDALGIKATPDGARLRCGFQKLESRATPHGLWLESSAAGGGELRLVATSAHREVLECGPDVSGPQSTTLSRWCPRLAVSSEGELPTTGTVSVEDTLVRFRRPGVTEEYSVSVDGVRQDFVIADRPAGAGDLQVELALTGARAEAAVYGAKVILESSGRALAYSRLRVEDATGQELTARLEVLSAGRLAVRVADANATYPVRIDPTFSDANWVSLNPGMPGADDKVWAIAADASGDVYVGGDFTVIGAVVANYIAKWNGSAWSALGSGMNGYVDALLLSGTTLYAGGGFTTAGGVKAQYIAAWNGSAWSALGAGMDYDVYALVVSGSDLYAGGDFSTAGGVTANCVAKWNGSAWSAVGSGLGGGDQYGPYVSALAVSGTTLYAGGDFGTAGGVTANYIAKWNGSVWSAVGTGMDSYVYALAVSGTTLYAGGDFGTAGGVTADYIAKWNGSAWSALGTGLDGDVDSLAVSGTTLYAGGYFGTAGAVTANNIAKWNGSAWSALGSGTSGDYGDVYALAVSGTSVYAGGDFFWAGGVTANFVGAWNGNTWSALGAGTDSDVYALAASGTTLYLGGDFTMAGGAPANYIAAWNGSTWSALGTGMDSDVYALAASGNTLYAGGDFTTAGGVSATNIAAWNGSAWSALGTGMDSDVYALAVSGTTLYAGGDFSTAGGLSASYIAKWNGSAWSPLGTGLDGDVESLAVSGNTLYAGGYFTTAGGVSATNIAAWNASAWSALGTGMDSDVYALAVSGTTLYAGGDFTTAGGLSANHVAAWNGSAWSALGSGMNTNVYTLVASGMTLYAGGQFSTAGGVAVNGIAAWDGSAWSALGSGIGGGSFGGNGPFVSALAADGAGHLFVGGEFSMAGTNVSPFIAQADVSGVPPGGVIQSIRVGGGTVTLDCQGIAGSSYAVQRATNVLQWTQNLTTLLKTNAPANGLFLCTDPIPPAASAFYRLLQQ
jgi:hypothetical protein